MSPWKKKFDSEIEKPKSNKIKENFDVSSMQKKIHKIKKKKYDNPKKIPMLEQIYELPQSGRIIEGFHYNEDGHLAKTKMKNIFPSKDSVKKSEKDSESFGESLEKSIDNIGNRFSQAAKQAGPEMKKTEDNLNSLGNELDQSFSDLDQLQNIGSMFSGLGDGLTATGSAAKNLESAFKVNTKQINKTIASASSSVNSVVQIFTNFLYIIGQQLKVYRLKFQMFILKSNKYVKQTIVRISNALTQNTATEKEIEIFQDQTQKFITLLLVWYFVFNWYYIIFFLEEEDNIRYKFQFTKSLMKASKWIYGFFGVGLKPFELFNQLVLKLSVLKEYCYTSVLMILLFFVFYKLVQDNFQISLLQDFFNALSGKAGSSLISLFCMMVVIYHSLEWFFGSQIEKGKPTGFIEMTKLVIDGASGGVWTGAFSAVCFVVAALGYLMWTMSVSVPMSTVLISGYLVLYTFFGVLFYEGFNCFSIFAGITSSVDSIPPDLTPEACQPSSPFLTFAWFYETGVYILQMLARLANFASANMFEILILLTLISGISVYKNNWSGAAFGKIGIDEFTLQNIGDVFKHLFLWLIIINIGLIALFLFILFKKWKLQFSSDETMSQDISKQVQTKRTSLGSTRKSGSSAVSTSKMKQLKQNLKNFDVKEELSKGDENVINKENERNEEKQLDEVETAGGENQELDSNQDAKNPDGEQSEQQETTGDEVQQQDGEDPSVTNPENNTENVQQVTPPPSNTVTSGASEASEVSN